MLLVAVLAVFSAFASEIPSTAESCTQGDAGCTSTRGQSLLQAKLEKIRQHVTHTNPTPWTVDVNAFSDSMTMTAVVKINGEFVSQGHLFAFVGDECRGVQEQIAGPPFGPFAGVIQFPMTIYANVAGESLSFKFVAGGRTESWENLFVFATNDNKGSAIAPYVLEATDPPPPASSWESFDYARFESTMTMWAIVIVGGLPQGTGTLAAFNGDDMTGLEATAMVPPFGDYAGIPMYPITIYGDTPYSISFKYKMESGEVKTLSTSFDLFGPNKLVGTATSPWLLY